MNTWQYKLKDPMSRLKHLLESRELADCVFLVGAAGVRVEAHRVIMAATSSLLHEKLQAASDKPVVVKDVEPDIFEFLLMYVYLDEVEITSSDVAFDLAEAARVYRLPHLEEHCYAYMTKDLNPHNVLRGYQLALRVKDEQLTKDCEEVIRTKTIDVLKNKYFVEASVDTVEAIFSLESLEIDSETELLKAADRYITHYYENKKESDRSGPPNIRNAIKKIRFLTLTAREFVEGRVGTNVLSASDSWAVLTNIASDSSGVPMPDGFSTRKDPRKEVKPKEECKVQFKFNLKDVMSKTGVCSSHFAVQDVPFKVWLGVKVKDSVEYLSCFVYCKEKNRFRAWSCNVEVTLSLLRPGMEPHGYRFEHVFTNCNEMGNGYPQFLKLEDATNPKNNYLRQDALTLQVLIRAEKPDGL